jgi:hypothetical protein
MYKRRQDFEVQWQGNMPDTVTEIFDHLFYRRIKGHKPCVILITGGSGEGKSSVGLHIADKQFEHKGLDFADYVGKSVVGGIEDFEPKAKAVLFEHKMKKCFVLMIDEAAATVNSKDWASLTNKAVNFINHMSRAIKPLIIIIVAQSLLQVDSQTRQTVNFYMKVHRSYPNPAQVKIYRFVVTDKDVLKPKLEKRLVRGNIVYGKKKEFTELRDIQFPKVRQAVWDIYEKNMLESKAKLLEDEFDKLAKHLKEKNEDFKLAKYDKLTKFLTDNPYILNQFTTFRKDKWKLKEDFVINFGVSKRDKGVIEKMLIEKMSKGHKNLKEVKKDAKKPTT